jgi:hypothetical protein
LPGVLAFRRAATLARTGAARRPARGLGPNALSEITPLSAQAMPRARSRASSKGLETTEQWYAVIRDHGLAGGRKEFA